ncbi:MAG: ester cyclase [Lysobacterales bacterium]
MSTMETASEFFDACETGKGWENCQEYCHADAGFSAQADALTEVTTLQGYCDWMQGLFVPVPNGRYELKGMALDEARATVLAFATFHGTHTVEGPMPPTGKTVASDYVYAITFDGDKISHMTKIWNDGHALRQFGWA